MKNTGTLIVSLIILLLIISCKNEPSKMIIGDWKVADIAFSTEISDELKQAQQESLDVMKASSSWNVKADGTFKKTISEESIEGKWSLSSDAKKLTLNYPDGEPEISDIIELSENKLIVSIKINDIQNTITWEKQSANKK